MMVVCGGALSFWWLVKVLDDADGGCLWRCFVVLVVVQSAG